MHIWKYELTQKNEFLEIFWRRTCLFCQAELYLSPTYGLNLGKNKDFVYDWWRPAICIGQESELSYAICLTCGWWNAFETKFSYLRGFPYEEWRGVSTVLKELDMTDLSRPICETRNYLMAKYEARYSLPPRLFENVVASVFKNLGYEVYVTAYTHDGGIDIILNRDKNELIGVQVKRYKKLITVEQLRSFAGAHY